MKVGLDLGVGKFAAGLWQREAGARDRLEREPLTEEVCLGKRIKRVFDDRIKLRDLNAGTVFGLPDNVARVDVNGRDHFEESIFEMTVLCSDLEQMCELRASDAVRMAQDRNNGATAVVNACAPGDHAQGFADAIKVARRVVDGQVDFDDAVSGDVDD